MYLEKYYSDAPRNLLLILDFGFLIVRLLDFRLNRHQRDSRIVPGKILFLVLDAPRLRNRVFLRKNLVVTRRFGKKPGFFGMCASRTDSQAPGNLLLI